VLALAALGAIVGVPGTATAAGPAGQLVYGVHISLAPTWFDPAETPSLVTPYMIYYALHDAMLKPMPGEPMAHSLAESWSATEDGMNYSFVLRDGVTFHNGERVTADDVKFSFERYRGAGTAPLKERVASGRRRHTTSRSTEDPGRTSRYAHGAGCRRKYVEKVATMLQEAEPWYPRINCLGSLRRTGSGRPTRTTGAKSPVSNGWC
jgi:ABC-type transport system substrate-binding protein